MRRIHSLEIFSLAQTHINFLFPSLIVLCRLYPPKSNFKIEKLLMQIIWNTYVIPRFSTINLKVKQEVLTCQNQLVIRACAHLLLKIAVIVLGTILDVDWFGDYQVAKQQFNQDWRETTQVRYRLHRVFLVPQLHRVTK